MKVWNDPFAFSERVMSELLKKEAENSLMIGILENIKRDLYDTYHQLTVEDDGQLLAIMQVTPPHPLNYVVVDTSQATSIHAAVIPTLLRLDIPFTEVVSERAHAEAFAAVWQKHTNEQASTFMSQGLYRLDHVDDIDMADGLMRQATRADQPLLEEWYRAFELDSGLEPSTDERMVAVVTAMIENDDAVIWEVDGTPVSCAKRSRPTTNGVTVSFVYTDPRRRGNGYARSLVAELSRKLLTDKQFCTLYTDLTNPTSNKIYQEVGYRPIMESSWIRLAR
ncbi:MULTISPECIES: GNAT family N-acetyltransferase [unclassified Exiguobacterium]|uniref:GNAT family N-acetyltransferase n=1 Tax=unclassified Exiguobacterium TaxID=2644629 RepID=UPI001F2EE0CD|nr:MULTISPECIES: GNAT family N-acetyltransferase [unclassified Exiguobacterium]